MDAAHLKTLKRAEIQKVAKVRLLLCGVHHGWAHWVCSRSAARGREGYLEDGRDHPLAYREIPAGGPIVRACHGMTSSPLTPRPLSSPQGEEKPQRRSKRAVKSKAEEDEEVAERDLREDQPQERQPSPEAPPVAPKRASKRKQEGVIAADASSQPAKKQRTESEKPGASTRPKRERADTVAPSISRRPEKKTKSNAHKGKEPAEVEAQEESGTS